MARALRDVLESILAGVVVVDPDGQVEDMNSAASRILGRSREATLGDPIERVVAPDHAIARLARSVLDSGAPTTEAQAPIGRPGEEELLVDITASPLFGEGGDVDGAVLVLRDGSAQRRLESLESERERLRDFGRIAAGLAHEIKNPLGGIRGAGELLERRAGDDKTREIAGLVVREATRIAGLVEDFMVLARGDKLRAKESNVHRMLDEVVELLGLDPLAANVTIEREYDPSIPDFLMDRDRLIQVFLNLGRNALEAMGGEGRLAFRTRMTLDHRITLSPGHRVPTVAISVVDSGRGMTEDELREATTPFFTTRADGTGLGLAVADHWVAQHQGTLDFQSEPGVGTRARVALPLRRETE